MLTVNLVVGYNDKDYNYLYSQLLIINMQTKRTGIEKNVEMNSPLESKYCCFENFCQFAAASSLIYSEK